MSFLTLALLATDAWFTMDEDATETQVQSFLLIPADNVAMEHPPLPVVRRSSASGDRFGRGSLSLNHLEVKAVAFQHMPATFLSSGLRFFRPSHCLALSERRGLSPLTVLRSAMRCPLCSRLVRIQDSAAIESFIERLQHSYR